MGTDGSVFKLREEIHWEVEDWHLFYLSENRRAFFEYGSENLSFVLLMCVTGWPCGWHKVSKNAVLLRLECTER